MPHPTGFRHGHLRSSVLLNIPLVTDVVYESSDCHALAYRAADFSQCQRWHLYGELPKKCPRARCGAVLSRLHRQPDFHARRVSSDLEIHAQATGVVRQYRVMAANGGTYSALGVVFVDVARSAYGLYASYGWGTPVGFFGLGYLPVLIGKNEPLRLLTDTLHVCLVWVLCILVIGHIGAALKHRLIDRDSVIQRMLRV